MSIRKSKVRIEDSVFWICFSLVLVVISVFPGIIDFGARLAGIQSSQNFLFLVIIFILTVKLFRMTVRVSQLDSKLQGLAQSAAIDRKLREDARDNGKS